MNREINVGDVWRRRVERHDEWDRVRVVGVVDFAGQQPNEYTITSATAEFGTVLQTEAAGILDHCTLVTSGDPEAARWETADVLD